MKGVEPTRSYEYENLSPVLVSTVYRESSVLPRPVQACLKSLRLGSLTRLGDDGGEALLGAGLIGGCLADLSHQGLVLAQ